MTLEEKWGKTFRAWLMSKGATSLEDLALEFARQVQAEAYEDAAKLCADNCEEDWMTCTGAAAIRARAADIGSAVEELEKE